MKLSTLLSPSFFRFLSGFVAIILLALGFMFAINFFDLQIEKEAQIACPESLSPEDCA